MDNDPISQLSELFVALSDATRLRLLSLIGDGEVSVGYLADELGESQPKVSRHLAYLRNARLVSTRRDGKWVYYSIDPPDDAGARRVLDQTLAVLGVDPTEPFYPQHTETVKVAELLMDDYHPNEIEIYLL